MPRVAGATAVGRFRANDSRYESSLAGRPVAATPMTSVLVLRVRRSDVTTDQYVAGNSNAAGGGGFAWIMRPISSPYGLRIIVAVQDGADVLLTTATASTAFDLEQGRVIALAFTYTSPTLQVFGPSGTIGAAATAVNAGVTAGTRNFVVGDRPTNVDSPVFADVLAVHHVQGFAAVSPVAYLDEVMCALRQNRALPRVRAVAGSDFLWDARDIQQNPLTWTDQISGHVLTKVGAPELKRTRVVCSP